ncbi:Para-aminobenzoate synthase component 1 [Limihaloglobus sulfuriphilus]|uniref:Para-aminobenzoate synthase component 1 n=1 Tax=Limihaloglobus sulfuriphilus TaxID=1851148 RepID=A0A1Q2MDZ1_9BACT|nr:aminodeoxychorismate synthase component I [Limihaloglobus sulfuriphilus]AQQ70869.1 Para-aminobenzoate synthase component 1 [Limihaloglobus sulfuriphilus]
MNTVLIQTGDYSETRWYSFEGLREIILAQELEKVTESILKVEKFVSQGYYAAGFISYEAAAGFDKALKVKTGSNRLPLVWFGIFKKIHLLDKLPATHRNFTAGKWKPQISKADYLRNVQKIKEYLGKGDTYQINYTFPLRTDFKGSPLALFNYLCGIYPSGYSSLIETDDFAICSVSPELFFELDGENLKSKPMKGTAPRGVTNAQDKQNSQNLRTCLKNRAENCMIVDMIRNDMGRIAKPGSVNVPAMFEIEKYPTVLQMTSTINCRTAAPFSDIVTALFPCASITGAPKVRSMKIIDELEGSPRGVYTGSIGYLLPGREARFNVAIRTVTIDKTISYAEYGTGGGIVWDSTGQMEYEEAASKTRVLNTNFPEFELLESILWESGDGWLLLDRHISRLKDSAEYFDFSLNTSEIRASLESHVSALSVGSYKIRLLVSKNGKFHIQSEAIAPSNIKTPLRLAIAKEPVDISNPFLYHKTTCRGVYHKFRNSVPDCDDVILWNAAGEITETTIANIVIEQNGRLFTPPVECGLLGGSFRAELLETGKIQEAVIKTKDLERADTIYTINSVRKWTKAALSVNDKS